MIKALEHTLEMLLLYLHSGTRPLKKDEVTGGGKWLLFKNGFTRIIIKTTLLKENMMLMSY